MDPVEGVAVEVLLYDNIEWTSILTDTSTPTGIVTRNLLSELGPGIYSYKVLISEGNLYYGATETKQYVVSEITTDILVISAPSNYFYGSMPVDRYVELQLVVNNLNQPLAGFELTTEFGSLIFTNTSDVDGKISYHLPKYENPGTKTLTVSFFESGVYKSSQLILEILVDGIDTNIDWIQLPADTFYGEILSTSVVVTDNNGNPLVNYEVVLTINDLSYSRYSDSNGEVYFSIELRTDLGISTVEVELKGTLGFDPAKIALDINHDKRDIEMDISTSLGLLEAKFGYPTEFLANPYVIIDSIPYQLTDCIIEVYWADVFGGNWILIDTVYYDGNPFSVILPEQDVGVTQFIKFIAIDYDYHPKEMVIELEVVQGSVFSDVSSTSNAYGDNITISIELSNYYGTILSGTHVEFRYVDPYTSQIVFSMSVNSDENGIAFFEFIAFDSGTLQFDFVIGDGTGNYLLTAGTHSVTVRSRNSVSTVYFASFSGQGYIYINITDTQTGMGVDGLAEIYLFDGSDYILQQTLTVDTGFGYYTLINLQASNTYYVLIRSMIGYDNIEAFLNLDKEQLTVEIGEQTVQTQLDNSFVFTITGNTDLNDMYVVIYYYDSTISNWIELNTVYLTSKGISKDMITINLDLGYYDLKLYIPEQIWFEEKLVFEVLHVVKKEVNLLFDPINVYSNMSATIEIITIDDNTSLLNGIDVELYLGNELISTSTTIDGVAKFIFTLDIPLGEYSGKIITLETDIVAASEVSITIYVWREANIDYNVIEAIVYTDGGIISIKVTDYDTGDAIADASVSLAYKYLFEWINLGSSVSNNSGIALIYVDTMTPGNYLMRATMTQVDVYGSVYMEKTVTVLPETVNINFEIINYGITHNQTISFDVFDEAETIDEGNIYWKILTVTDQVFDQGSFVLKETNELVIPGDLIGNYSLIISYGHDQNYYVYNSELSTVNIGFDEIHSLDIQIDYFAVDFTDTELVILISHDGNTIAGLDILVYTNFTGYINLISDNNGLIVIPISYDLPGEYTIKIEIISSIYISDDFTMDLEITVNRANIGFEVQVPETVYFSDILLIEIDDKYLNTSIYEIRIITPDGYHLLTSERFNSSMYEIILDLDTGQYYLAIVRFNDLLVDEVVKQIISIVEKPVVINIEYIVNPDNDTVELIIKGLFDNQNIEEITYNLTIYNGGVFYYQINSSLTITVYGVGSIDVFANAMSPYSGGLYLMIHYDVTVVDSTDISGVVDTMDILDDTNYFTAGSIIGSIISLGAGVQLKPILTKRYGNKS